MGSSPVHPHNAMCPFFKSPAWEMFEKLLSMSSMSNMSSRSMLETV